MYTVFSLDICSKSTYNKFVQERKRYRSCPELYTGSDDAFESLNGTRNNQFGYPFPRDGNISLAAACADKLGGKLYGKVKKGSREDYHQRRTQGSVP